MNNAGKVKHIGLLKPLSIACLLQVFMASTAHAYNATGNEDRCDELGANCLCSEPLNTDNLPVIDTYWKNPADTTAKECKARGGQAAIGGNNHTASPTSHMFSANDIAVLSKLPNRTPEVQHYLRAMDGTNPIQHTASFYVGASNVTTLKKRMAVRWYVYHSPDFVFNGINESDCPVTIKSPNTKFAQFAGLVGNINSSFQFYSGWIGMTYNKGQNTVIGCCTDGPPSTNARVPLSTWQGNWLRFEAVIINPQGGASPNGLVLKAYVKNITTDEPEFTLIDSTVYDPKLTKAEFLGADDLTPPGGSPIDGFLSNNYREGTCAGFRAISHYMLAGWDTDEGQRIGAAKELESNVNPPKTVKPKDWDAKSKIDKM